MSSNNCPVTITPDTKLGELFASYPKLEAVVAELSSSFKALGSPAVRQSVARTTTLAQLATADNLSIGTVIDTVRNAVGQTSPYASDNLDDAPDWATTDRAVRSLDARQMLQEGGHPLERVMTAVGELGAGDVYELITPFVPSPLIDLVKQRGFDAHCITVSPGECRTYFRSK